MSLTKEQILQADDLKREKLNIPEWSGDVYVRSMTALQRDSFERLVQDKKAKNIRALIVARTCCDEEGKLIFTDADAIQLSHKSASACERIFSLAIELSSFSDKDIDELEKN